ncbi:hypothetical protein HCN44_009511 [Aphidius gifuensis]|uniref:Lipocalin/cytosolic fatty-acid binding domain-containing protein n=2 Tax=Aphidius gifuensis TaxID=684658 RepID=A0A834Y2I5_APHGI|nr:hypothetical protein HCN44_009511 [Aphidius gifuensis]
MKNFNKPEYAGPWYDIARIPNIFEVGQKCSVFDYKFDKHDGSFNIDLLSKSKITGNSRNLTGAARPRENEPSSVLNLYYPDFLKIGVLTVLDTDYKNYAVVTTVSSVIGSIKLQMAWIWSREPTLSPEYYQLAEDVLRVNDISPDKLKLSDQCDC